jgi:hypothetical protein
MSLLAALRSHPRVRAFARRHVHVFLARARTWANVDSALRLLAEDPRRPVTFGTCDDPLLDVLYWQPFVRWAEAHFSLTSGRDGVPFPCEPVLALVEDYRSGNAAPRPLLKRLRFAHVPDDAARGGVLPWGAEAMRGVLAGAPTIAVIPETGAVEPDLDLALRAAAELGESLSILRKDQLTRLLQAICGPDTELQ